MARQLVICMETNKKAATDYVYIKETIDRFYICNNKIRISPVFMNTKSRYNSKDVKNEIKKYIKDFIIGETDIIYCIDTDSYENDVNHARELKEIENYCIQNGYELIWFCHDVEEVYLGKKIADKTKTSEAGDFRRKNKICTVSEEKLNSKIKSKNHSNILCVLDKILSRK